MVNATDATVNNPFLQNAYPDSLRLRFVSLVTRHGARVPLNTFPNDDSSWNCNHGLYASLMHSSIPGLESGSQTVSIEYEQDAQHFSGNCARGQLTPAGLSQHVTLGGWLRENYIQRLNHIDVHKVLDDEASPLYIRSTDTTRTQQSAKAFLTGLFPDIETSVANPLRIHVRETRVENMYPRGNCPRFSFWHMGVKGALAANRVKHRDALSLAVLRALHSHEARPDVRVAKTGLGPDQLPSWEGLNNSIACRQLSGIPIPRGLTPGIIDAVEAEAALDGMSKSATLYQRRLGIGRFLKDMIAPLRQIVSAPRDGPGMALYFGHDNTLVPLLMALDVPTYRVPEMASHLTVELFNEKDQPRKHHVRVLFNGVPRKIRSCPKSDHLPEEFCAWETFATMIDGQIPGDYAKECILPDNKEELDSLVDPAGAAFALAAEQAKFRDTVEARAPAPPSSAHA